MGSPAGPKMLELERRHSGASQASSRAGRRPDASSAAASLQQRLSAGQQSVARISPLGGAVAKSDQMQGGVERRRSSSTAVLRVLQHCQELEEDLAARNWMQVGGESGRSQTGGSEDEFKRNGGDRMSSGRGGAKGGRAESMGASQDETGWNAGEMPESRPHSERSFDMRDRHSKHVVSSLGQSRSHPHSSSGTPEPNQDVRNCARHSDGRFGRPSDGVPNEGNLGASDSDRAVEKDSRRQPSWFEEEERTSGGAKRASERASAGAKRASARSEKVSKRESVLEEKEHRQPSWLDETSGGPGSASGTRSEASERGFQRSKIASGGAGRASVRESLIGENEHRELSWLEDKEAASLGQKRPSERASEKAFYRVSERTPGRKSEQEIEHRKQSWLAEEEWRPEAVRRASERAFGTASEGTSRQASGRASLDGEKDHRHQGWLRLSQDDSNLQGLPEERAGSGNGLAKRFGVEGRAESDDAVEKVGDEAGDRQTVRQSDFYPKPQRRGSAGAELVQAERPADNLAGSGDQRRSVGGFEPADRFVSAEGTNVREGRRFADHRRGSEGAMREMGELSERESLTKRKSTTGGQVERPSKGGGHNSRDHSRSRSASRTSAGRLSDKVAKSASGEPLPDQLQSEKHVTEDARLLKVQESRTAQGATGASYSAAKSAKRLSENRDVAEGQSKIERSEGSIDREEVGARAFRDEVEVLRLAEGEPSWTSAEPSGFLGRGEMKRPSGSSRGASGRTTPIVGTNFDDVASERGLEETVTEKRETPETRPESCATETEKRKTRKSSFGGSTIRAFFDEDTWQNRSGPPSVRESLGGSAADRRPASHLSEVGPFRSAPASKRIGTENGSGVQRASGSRVSAACVSASRQSDNVTRGSLSKDFGTRVSRFASAGTRAERNSPAESPASLSGRNGPNGRVSSDERNSVVGKASADGQGILNGRSDLNGRNSSDGRNTSNGRTDLDGGESLDGWVHAADRRTSDKRGSLSGRADSDGRNERSGRNELNERNERNGTRAATNAEPEKRSTSEETYAAATRERPVVGRAPPGSARAGSVQTEKRPDFVRSNKDHPRSTRSLEELARKSARAQVSERGESRPRQRVEVHESQGEQWADKRVTRESERGEVRVDRGGGHQKGAHVTRNNGWEATPNDGVRSRQAPSNGRFQKERLDDRFQFEDRDLDERSSEDGRSGYDSDSCRITTGGRSAREKQPGWGSGTRGPVHTARLRNPGAEMTEKQRYEKELEALSELVKEYETNALQKHRRDLESGASRSQFLLEPDTGSTLLGTPVSELSLDLPTPPEPRKKREALGGLPGKQTGGQPAKGAGNLKKSLAQTRQAAREAIKSVRAVYCASGCATQQVREGERVWKQQLALARTSERELKARAQRAEVQATRLGSLLDWRVREVAHLKAALAERTARLDQAELRLDELEGANAAAGEGMREALKVAKKERDHILYLLRKALKQLKSADHQLQSGHRPPRYLPERFRTEPADLPLGASEGDSDSAAMTTPGSDATSPTCDDVTLTPLAHRGAKQTYDPIVLDDWAAKMAELQRSLDKQRSILTDNRRWS